MRVQLTDIHVEDETRWWDPEARDATAHDDQAVYENRQYAIAIYEYDPSADYAVFIGDEQLRIDLKRFTNFIEFAKGAYFESASGPTVLSILAMKGGVGSLAFRKELYVIPSKIGWNNYKRMVLDLQSVCRALVVDIRGKSGALAAGRASDGFVFRPWRTLDEELDSVCGVARRLRPLIAEIRRAPKHQMKLCPRTVSTVRCHSPRAIASLMKRGIVPGESDAARVCSVGLLAESVDIPEHRLFKAFLRLLVQRLTDCRAGLAHDIRQLEAEKKYRTRTGEVGGSLYETEDLPKIRRFRRREAEAAQIQEALETELAAEFWQGVGEEVFAPDGTQFGENDYYLKSVNLILRYLRDPSHWGSAFGSHLRAKKSSRMYEQWVLVELVAAFGACGVEMTTWDEVLRRSVNRQFGFDFARNTTLTASLGDGYELVLRYEPWILSREEARRNVGETLFHFGNGNWSPDIMLELVRTDGTTRRTVYAIALDAKYTRHPTREMRENIAKYAKIRAVGGAYWRRVARQVWLVYPGEESRRKPFWFDDEALGFTPAHGVTYRDVPLPVEPTEQVIADLIALPGGGKGEEATDLSDVGLRPKRVFLDFAQGTLAYFRDLCTPTAEPPPRI